MLHLDRRLLDLVPSSLWTSLASTSTSSSTSVAFKRSFDSSSELSSIDCTISTSEVCKELQLDCWWNYQWGNIELLLLEKADHLMWKWARLFFCIVKRLQRRSPPVCKDILKWKPGRNENFDLHLLLTLKSALRWGDENDEGRGTWCVEGRLRVPLPTASLGWIQMGSYALRWIRMDFERF